MQFSNVEDFLPLIQCNVPSPDCYFHMCEQCCDEIKVAEVHDLLNANLIEEVTYRKWTSTDKSMLETVV